MADNLYGSWGLAELVTLVQAYPWSCLAAALAAGMLIHALLHPQGSGDGGVDLFWGDNGDGVD